MSATKRGGREGRRGKGGRERGREEEERGKGGRERERENPITCTCFKMKFDSYYCRFYIAGPTILNYLVD